VEEQCVRVACQGVDQRLARGDVILGRFRRAHELIATATTLR
jgi:hypothetical protein